jgi:hypothetical protein
LCCAKSATLGGAQHQRAVAQAARLQRVVVQRADAHRHVPALVHQTDHGVGQAQLHRDGRVPAAEFGHQRRDAAHAIGQRRVQPQQAGGQRALRRGGRIGLVDVGQDALHGMKIRRAGVGQRQLARAAVQQPDAQPRLQRIHVLGGHGGRHVELPRGARQAAGLGGAGEHAQTGDAVHDSTLWVKTEC